MHFSLLSYQVVNPRLLDMVKKGNTFSRSKYNQRGGSRQIGGNMNDHRNNRTQQRPRMRPANNQYQPTGPYNETNLAQKSSYLSRATPMNYQHKNSSSFDTSESAIQLQINPQKFNCNYQSKSPASAAFNIYTQQQQQHNYQNILQPGMSAIYNVPPPPMTMVQYNYPPPILPVKN